jgi:hypothetical protein
MTVKTAPDLTVNVTPEHLKRRDHCMSSAALLDAATAFGLNPGKLVVSIRAMSFSGKGYRYVYPTPLEVRRRMIQWDQGDKVEPFSFTLVDGVMTETPKDLPVQSSR